MVLNQLSNPTFESMMSASVMEATPQDEIERCAFWMALNITAQTGV